MWFFLFFQSEKKITSYSFLELVISSLEMLQFPFVHHRTIRFEGSTGPARQTWSTRSAWRIWVTWIERWTRVRWSWTTRIIRTQGTTQETDPSKRQTASLIKFMCSLGRTRSTRIPRKSRTKRNSGITRSSRFTWRSRTQGWLWPARIPRWFNRN